MINLRSDIHLALLSHYFKNPEKEYFVRELSRELGIDAAQLSREFAVLTRFDLFTARRNNREKYFRINTHHPLYEELKKITAYIVDKKSTNKN